MAIVTEVHRCPHCDTSLEAFELVENEGWADPVQYACFNDDCPYFQQGWVWMWEHYAVKASYRYRLDPASGLAVPIPVLTADALRNRILPNAETRP